MTVQQPYNIYMQVASESGYTGLFVFILLIVAAFRINMKTRRIDKNINSGLFCDE